MEVIIGISIGLVLGLTGSGGSILALPLFVVFLALDPVSAAGLSLGVVAASASLGVLGQIQSRNILWLPAIVYAVIGSAFTPLGLFVAKHLPAETIILGFCCLITIVARLMWRKASTAPEQTRIVRSGIYNHQNTQGLCRMNNRQPFQLGLPCILGVSGGAIGTGFLSGLFGVGGGFIIVPSLMFLLGITIQQAVATSLLIITFISSAGFANYMISNPAIDLGLLIKIVIGGSLGIFSGLILSKHISGPKLQKLFVIVILMMAIMMLNKYF